MSGSAAEAQALAHFRAGRLAEARAAWSEILRASPDDPQALHMVGYILTRMGERDEGLRLMDASIERAPRAAPFLNNRAQVLAEDGRVDDAIGDLRRAVQLDAGFTAAYVHLAILLRRAQRLDEALAALRRALALEPAHAAARENLGLVLNQLGLARKDAGDLEQAAAAFEAAFAEGVASPAHALNAASVSVDRGRLDEAEALYARALEAKPGWADAQYGLAQVHLRRHAFASGWAGYERRFESDPPQSKPRDIGLPRLRAEELRAGVRVAVWSEQGVGDQLLFSTLLPELASHGVRAVVEVDERLLAMYRRSVPQLEFTTLQDSARAFAACERALPIGSLPSLLRGDRASFARQPRPLLRPDEARVAAIRARLGPGRWIALSWRSLQPGARHALAARKSIDLERFAALADAGFRLLDVQYGDVEAEREAFVRRHPGILTKLDDLDAYTDLEGVAAALAACEAVVTSSNVTAHLAGAIGQATYLAYMEARAPFAYWVPDGKGNCLWYPSIKIVTDARWTRWEDAIAAVAARLAREST
jgi:tetratricopeptide (TPR) repeat protein